MKAILISVVLLPLVFISSAAFAEPPARIAAVAPASSASDSERTVVEEVIKAKAELVKRGLSMVFYKSEKGNSEAFLTVEPDFNPGCKLQLTLLF